MIKAWVSIDGLKLIRKSGIPDKIRLEVFRVVTVSALLNGYTNWLLTKCLEKKLHESNTRMLRAVLNNSWKAASHKRASVRPLTTYLTDHLSKMMGIKDKLVSDFLLWNTKQRFTSVDLPGKSYIHQLCVDARCCLEDLTIAITL